MPLSEADITYIEKELKQTTVGYKNKHWTIPPPGTHWYNAMTRLALGGPPTTPTPPTYPIPPVTRLGAMALPVIFAKNVRGQDPTASHITRYGSTAFPIAFRKDLRGQGGSPPTTGDPAYIAFQALWDATKMPVKTWSPMKVATSQADLDSKLSAAVPGTHIQAKGFTYHGRLALNGKVGPIWLDCDPTFEVIAPVGVYGQGFWTVDCEDLYITGFPLAHNCGNQGLLDQGSKNCYFEIDVKNNGGTGVLAKDSTRHCVNPVYKIRGGSNGLDLTLDPHSQKGTGNHFMNSWFIQGGKVLLDIDDQPYGAGLESTGLVSVEIAVRAKSLSCNVDTLPPGPGGIRQTGGNGWQPWDASPGGPHHDCIIKAISLGSCAQGVYGALGSSSNSGNIVEVGRVGSHRKSPTWPTLPGVAYHDVV